KPVLVTRLTRNAFRLLLTKPMRAVSRIRHTPLISEFLTAIEAAQALRLGSIEQGNQHNLAPFTTTFASVQIRRDVRRTILRLPRRKAKAPALCRGFCLPQRNLRSRRSRIGSSGLSLLPFLAEFPTWSDRLAATAEAIERFHIKPAHHFRVVVMKLHPRRRKRERK